jgi:molybdopterin molybdotransferase
MVGATRVSVYSQPDIAVVSTGNELVEPQFTPDQSQIRNSNAYQLIAQTKALNLPVHYLGIAMDTMDDTRSKMREALRMSDVVIMSGAVSMGDYDYVPNVLKEEGFTVHFHGVSTKPGKKTIFATKDKHWFIGVPGNPVSAFVQFELLIKPLLMGIMGNHEKPGFIKLPIATDFHRKNAARKAFEPVVFTHDGKVKLVPYHGSAHINALSYADGLMVIEKDIKDLKEGELVDVRPI